MMEPRESFERRLRAGAKPSTLPVVNAAGDRVEIVMVSSGTDRNVYELTPRQAADFVADLLKAVLACQTSR